MAAIDFPSSPTSTQAFNSGGSVWEWDGTAWRVLRPTNPNTNLTFTRFNAGTATPTGYFYNAAFVLNIAGGTF